MNAPSVSEPSCSLAPKKTPTAEDIAKAKRMFELGRELDENCGGISDEALLQYERAYGLTGDDTYLDAMAQNQRARSNYAAAYRIDVDLQARGAPSSAERRAAIARELPELRRKIGEIQVEVDVDGATLYVDDVPWCGVLACCAPTPVRAAIPANPGRHKVTALKPGFAPATKTVALNASDFAVVGLRLKPAP